MGAAADRGGALLSDEQPNSEAEAVILPLPPHRPLLAWGQLGGVLQGSSMGGRLDDDLLEDSDAKT